MKKPIVISLSSNVQKEDVTAATKLLFMPWKYVQGSAIKELERWFRTYFKISYAVSFVNSRSALYAILYCLDIKKNDEVLVQAFNSVTIPNAIMATGATPIYVDIDSSLNIDPEQIEEHITKQTKAIIVQHTFGIPANLEKITKIADKYKLVVIEDCSHTIGGEYKGQKLGTFGLAACYSFGRTKAFSSIFGGMATTNDKILGQKIRSYQKQKSFPLYPWVMQQLLYRVVSSFIFNAYYFLYIGKIIHFLFKRSRFFYETIASKEKKGEFNPRSVKKFPNALASLAIVQLKKIKEYNQTRQNITEYYKQNLIQKDISIPANTPLLRFPYTVTDKKKTLAYFSKKGIYLGDWFAQVIDPVGVDMKKINYVMGSCPNAEKMAERMINLPTAPTLEQKSAEKIISLLNTV